jgi:hypothetical protein
LVAKVSTKFKRKVITMTFHPTKINVKTTFIKRKCQSQLDSTPHHVKLLLLTKSHEHPNDSPNKVSQR